MFSQMLGKVKQIISFWCCVSIDSSIYEFLSFEAENEFEFVCYKRLSTAQDHYR